jgi:hypothetical protein
MEEAVDSMGEMASAVGRWADVFDGGPSVSVSELNGSRGENYFLGLV